VVRVQMREEQLKHMTDHILEAYREDIAIRRVRTRRSWAYQSKRKATKSIRMRSGPVPSTKIRT
jgi:hypothetical protein